MSDPWAESVPSLAERTVRGGSQLFLVRVVERALGAGRHLACAALLGPKEFGAFAVAALLLTALDALSEPGVRTALVRRRDVDDRALAAGWTLNVLRAVALAAALLLLAGVTSTYFASPTSAPYIRAIACVVMVRALQSPRVVTLERDLRFSLLARLGLARATVAFGVTIGWAVATRSAWALVVGAVAAEIVTTLGSYAVAATRPRFCFDTTEWKKIVVFGRWVTLSSMLVYGIVNLDDLVVGRLLGPAELAQYQIAYLLSNAAATEISLVVNRVLLPSLARSQDRIAALRSSFVQAYEVTALLATALAAVVAVAGGPVLEGILGDEWHSAASVVWMLSLWGAVRALGAATTPALFAIGRPQLVATFHLAMLVPMAVLVVPLTDRFGLAGAAAAILVPNAVVLAVRLPRVGQALGCGQLELYRRVAPSLLAMAGALAGGGAVRRVVDNDSLVEGALAGLAALACYLVSLTAADRVLSGSTRASASRAARLLLERRR